MKLLGLGGEVARLREYFDPGVPSTPNYIADAMQELLDELERVEHPPVWAYTSHWMLLLSHANDWAQWSLMIRVELDALHERPMFRVAYAMPEPWYSGNGFTDEAGKAAALVLTGLREAQRGKLRNLPFE